MLGMDARGMRLCMHTLATSRALNCFQTYGANQKPEISHIKEFGSQSESWKTLTYVTNQKPGFHEKNSINNFGSQSGP